ncbi:MAG: hypothetical protein U9N10_04070 [Bacillota bacterium]|nr:hypothetical protein [Bacillota bacterium]
MISIRQIKYTDLKKMNEILKKYNLNESDLINNLDTSLIMIENEIIIGLSMYENIDDEFGVINFTGYNIPFMDNNYRDGLYRATLNHMLYNGLEFGVILTTSSNFSFYNKLNIEKLDTKEVESLKILNRNSEEVVTAFKVEIDSFFNRPCLSMS